MEFVNHFEILELKSYNVVGPDHVRGLGQVRLVFYKKIFLRGHQSGSNQNNIFYQRCKKESRTCAINSIGEKDKKKI